MTQTPRNDNGPAGPDDTALRRAMRQSLQPAATADPARDALQQRVLAQWRQRHAPAADGPAQLASGPSLMLGATRRRQRWLATLVLLAVVAAATSWWLRPDPMLNELLQPDVLSQMTLGEL